jgi:DNA-binding transcriptional MerR regulator
MVDERGFELIRRLRLAHGGISLAEFKSMVRDQSNMLLIDQRRALDAIPGMLPPDLETRQKAFNLIKQILEARGARLEDNQKLSEVAALFLGPAQQSGSTSLSA